MADPQFLDYQWKTNPNHVQQLVDAQREAAKLPPFPPEAFPECYEVLIDSVRVMKIVAKKLKEADYDGDFCPKCKRKGSSPESLAKTLSYVAKTVDETTRLLEFAKGNVDSRPDNGLAELIKVLTPEQWQTFQGWISHSAAIDVTAK